MNWQAQADFIVIVSVAAGLMASLSASQAGKNVIPLERSEKISGTTAFSGAHQDPKLRAYHAQRIWVDRAYYLTKVR
jgi:succinate dehydrogenase/fumarate reductase flavoprotein subunit